MMLNRLFGPYRYEYWALLFCNCIFPQLLWFKKVRMNVPMLFIISIIVNIGMWLERFVIIVLSLHRDFVPSAWGMFQPTFWDWSTFIGTLGLFFTLFFLFVRLLPVISIFEMRTIVPEARVQEGHGH
jgi:molybdopterin-containing oxidoreductase family membrane subunit